MAGRWVAVKTLMIAALAVGLVAAACAKSTPTSSGAQSPSASSPASSGGAGRGYGGGYGGGGSPTSVPPNTVQQGAGGLRFDPTKITVREGVKLDVVNVGTTAHTFTVVGSNIDVVNQTGSSQKVAIDLRPGTYSFICRFHFNLGMRG